MTERKGHTHFGEYCECDMTEDEARAAMEYIADLEALIRRDFGESAVPPRPAELKPRIVTASGANILESPEPDAA